MQGFEVEFGGRQEVVFDVLSIEGEDWVVILFFDFDNNGDLWVVLYLIDMVMDIYERILELKDMLIFYYDGIRIQVFVKYKVEFFVFDYLV